MTTRDLRHWEGRAEKVEAELAALRPVVEAAIAVQQSRQWDTVESVVHHGGIAGSGNRLASALVAYAKRGKDHNG